MLNLRAPAVTIGAAALGAALLLTGCGGQHAASGSPDTSGQTRPGTTHPTSAPGGEVTTVRVVRDGGLKGGRVERTFSRDSAPPPGHTTADVRDALRVAAAPELAHLVLPSPASRCCDRYRFLITITYANGATRRFSTVQGEPWPPAFRALVRAAS
jgi:hypothetical protein